MRVMGRNKKYICQHAQFMQLFKHRTFFFFFLVYSHGVDVYVLDSGVNVDHSDFGGRASHEISFVSEEPEDDLGGHGKKKKETHFQAYPSNQLFKTQVLMWQEKSEGRHTALQKGSTFTL